MKTPIFADWEVDFSNTFSQSQQIDLYKPDPVNLYTEEPDLILAAKPYVLAPRYYLVIHPPKNNPNQFKITVPIHKEANSSLRNQFRVELEPSTGWGVNATYKVEYWQWTPLINKPLNTIKKECILVEHWYVPTIDPDTFLAIYPFDYRFQYPIDRVILEPFDQPRLTKLITDVSRIDNLDGTVTDTLVGRNLSHVFSFREGYLNSLTETIVTIPYPYNEQTLEWDFNKSLSGTNITRDANQVTGAITDGTVSTEIEYIVPLHPCQIRLIPDHLDLLTERSEPYYYTI